MSILWCGLCRNNVLLAETGLHDDGPADKLKKSILKKKPTAGWEFAEAFPRTSHHAVKLHVYEARDLVWSATCIYEGDASSLAKGFLEKIILMTEPLRPELKDGGELSAQQMLSPMLDQRMTAANSQGRVAMISDRVAEVKGIMNDNINVMLENHARIDHLEGQSQQLLQGASQFKKATNKLKRFYLMQNAKFGAAAGTAVTVGTAAVAVPTIGAAAGTGVGWGVGLGIAATAGVATGVATTVSRNKKSSEEAASSSSSAR